MKVKSIILTLVVLLISYACTKEDNSLTENGETITVTLNPSTIEINQGADVPMTTRSATADSIVYAVQVYENDSAYYYGLFDDISKMEIALTTGNTYKFKVAAYQAGTGKGLKTTVTNGLKTYYLPNEVRLANHFEKGNKLKDINKISSLRLIEQSAVSDYPEVDAFYCEKSMQVQKGISSIDIPLKRMGFGVTYNVDGLSSGKLYITMGKDSIVLDKNKTFCRTIRSFYSGSGDFTSFYSKADTLSQSILLGIKWIGDNGTTVVSQGYVVFKRNYDKMLNVSLNTSALNITFEGWSNTVTDIDGNVYHSVKIGTQTWMVENLKVTHYRNGDAIPNVTSSSSWATLNSGAYCIYNNDLSMLNIYGSLYNWYAANDSRGIAPKGWHIPSDAEWVILQDYLIANGYNFDGSKTDNKTAKSMAAATLWLSSSVVGAPGNTDYSDYRNKSGFTALPSGYRHEAGGFMSLGGETEWWSSTSTSSSIAMISAVRKDEIYAPVRFQYWKNAGFAIRCIKD